MKKYLIGFIIITILLSTAFFIPTKRAEAFAGVGLEVPVGENMLRSKETGITGWGSLIGAIKSFTSWDALAWAAVNIFINRLTQDVVNWINRGFEGRPLFVENPKLMLGEAVDLASGVFFTKLKLTRLCLPFRARIEFALRYNVPFEQRMACTLTDVIANITGFERSFLYGGWSAWLAMTMQPQNNIYGAYLASLDELERMRMEEETSIRLETSWGSGFYSWKECSEEPPTQQEYCDDDCSGLGGAAKKACLDDCMAEKMSKGYLCEVSGGEMMGMTPGKAIEDRLHVALGSDFARLEVADELNEIISALLQQLFKKIMYSGLGEARNFIPANPQDMTPRQGFTPLADCPNVQDENITKIQESVRPEYDYRNYKQGSLGFINDLIPNLTNLKGCYEDKKTDPEITDEEKERIEGKISGIDSEIEGLERQKDVDIPKDIADSNRALSVVDGYLGQIQTAPSCEAVETIYGNYLNELTTGNLSYQLHDSQAVADAETEYNTLNSRLGQINSEYNQCIYVPEEETPEP